MPVASKISPQGRLFENVLSELGELGYPEGERLERGYRFEDWFLPHNPERIADAAAFGEIPQDYNTACFAVIRSDGGGGPERINDYRSLGAPQAFEVTQDKVLLWRVNSKLAPKSKPLVIRPSELRATFRLYADLWKPEGVLRAKNIGPVEPRHRDFVDLGLIPALEGHIREKLDPLLRETVFAAFTEYEERNGRPIDPEGLFRLIFRAMAGKVMHDRGQPDFDPDPGRLLKKVAAYYNDNRAMVADPVTQRLVVERLWRSFSFKNLSVEVLAFVWENTFVDRVIRKKLGIHATPPSIARYIVRRLPIQTYPKDQRKVVEPCCGSGVFLVAALQRLRELLEAPGMTPKERHRYLKSMLSGFEIDAFGLEAARYCLMLADYPNANGWKLEAQDVFDPPGLAPKFYDALKGARVVLCNPPFQPFGSADRERYQPLYLHKPVELLSKILDHLNPEGILGFVLPQQVITGVSYRPIREALVKRFEEIEIVSLPDLDVFGTAEHETALLLAKRPRRGGDCVSILHRKVEDWPRFNAIHEVTREDSADKTVSEAADSLAVVDLREVWAALAQLPTIGDATKGEIHRGIEWNVTLKENRSLLISKNQKPGYRLGVSSAPRGRFYSYQCPPVGYLCFKPEYRRGVAAFKLPWGRPKAVMNAKRRSRGHWRISAFADELGLVCYQTYAALWPAGEWTATLLAAVLNAPVANAFVASHELTRDITNDTIKAIPAPRLTPELARQIENLVAEYLSVVELSPLEVSASGLNMGRTPSRVLREIDAAILAGYDLPPRLERQLLDYFKGHGDKRPVPFDFGNYFPANFRPFFSLSNYLSEEYQRSTAGALRERHKIPTEDVLKALGSAVEAYGE